jgi:hypothetical protein
MKPIYIVMAILASVTIVTIVTTSTQQVYAPRQCGGCSEFQKLTTEFEKDVLDAAAVNPPEPEKIQMLLDDYDKNVRMIFGLEPTTEGDPPGDTEASEDDDEPRTPGTP